MLLNQFPIFTTVRWRRWSCLNCCCIFFARTLYGFVTGLIPLDSINCWHHSRSSMQSYYFDSLLFWWRISLNSSRTLSLIFLFLGIWILRVIFYIFLSRTVSSLKQVSHSNYNFEFRFYSLAFKPFRFVASFAHSGTTQYAPWTFLDAKYTIFITTFVCRLLEPSSLPFSISQSGESLWKN